MSYNEMKRELQDLEKRLEKFEEMDLDCCCSRIRERIHELKNMINERR